MSLGILLISGFVGCWVGDLVGDLVGDRVDGKGFVSVVPIASVSFFNRV